MSAIAEAKRRSAIVQKQALSSAGMSATQYAALSRSYRLDGARRSAAAMAMVKVNTRDDKTGTGKAKRISDGHCSFRSDQWSVRARVGSPEFRADEARLSEL